MAAAHAAAFAFLYRRRGTRAAGFFLVLSAVGLAAAGGWRRAAAIAVLAAAAALLGDGGGAIGRLLLPAGALSLGTSLGLGILAISWAVSLKLFAGVFRPWMGAAAIVALGTWGLAARRRTEAAPRPAPAWSGSSAAAAELAFLLAAVAVVRSLAPESGFDALTRYLPWVKIAARTGGFPEIPWNYPFVLPQTGLAWATAFAFDPVAQRAAMLLPLAACCGIVFARSRATRGIGSLVVLALVSCPLVLSAGRGLQPDPVGWTAVLLLAALVCEATDPARRAFWFACGALAALAWCAKYSTAGFAAPLVGYAVWRAWKSAGPGRALFRAIVFGGAGAIVAGAPWLIHAWRESRNPFFPLLSSIFPSPLWRMRIDTTWGEGSQLLKGWRGLLFWPIDMTIHTNRFGEAHAGSFGLALLLFLFLGIASLRATDRAERVWLAAGAAGTLLLWTRTPYLRYWLPGLWLAVPAACRGAARLAERIGTRSLATALAGIVALQTALAALPSKADLQGLPWAVFTGRMTEEAYVARAPGASALARLSAVDRGWPKVCYTGLYAVGQANVVPIMGERWELAFHAPPRDRAALFGYVDSVGCLYWAVASALPDRAAYEALGIADRYWRPSQVVVRDATATVFRLSPSTGDQVSPLTGDGPSP